MYICVYVKLKIIVMIKLINLILKIIATIIFLPIGGLMTILAMIFWNTEYIEDADNILRKIWE